MKNIIIKEIPPEDVNRLISFLEKIGEETKYTLQYSGQEINIDKLNKVLKDSSSSDSKKYLGAYDGEKIIGEIFFERESLSHPYVRHNADFAMFVLKNCWGKGVAQDLFKNALNILRGWGIKRLEATVLKENQRALEFYKKLDFEIEGIRKGSILHSDIFKDELYIARRL